jgi:PTH1 family peptidyl-tRNA hydrolase
MHLIVGLGNPGEKYEGTRHNIGFDVIDYLANKYNIEINRVKFKGVYGEGIINGKKVMILKPTTYMNLSGDSIREVINFYKLSQDEFIVIYDDISLEVGRMRLRSK